MALTAAILLLSSSPLWGRPSHPQELIKTGLGLAEEARGLGELNVAPLWPCRILPPSEVVQLLSHVLLFATPWTAAHQAFLSFTSSQGLPKLMAIEWVMPSNHLILRHPLLLLPSIFPSVTFFSSKSALHVRWPKYWSFSFNISPSNEYSGLISFRMDWFDLFTVHGTLKSLL